MNESYVVEKVSKLNHSKFPREKSKIFLLGFTHIKPMPPTTPVYPQMSKGIFAQGGKDIREQNKVRSV